MGLGVYRMLRRRDLRRLEGASMEIVEAAVGRTRQCGGEVGVGLRNAALLHLETMRRRKGRRAPDRKASAVTRSGGNGCWRAAPARADQ